MFQTSWTSWLIKVYLTQNILIPSGLPAPYLVILLIVKGGLVQATVQSWCDARGNDRMLSYWLQITWTLFNAPGHALPRSIRKVQVVVDILQSKAFQVLPIEDLPVEVDCLWSPLWSQIRLAEFVVFSFENPILEWTPITQLTRHWCRDAAILAKSV